MGLTFFDAYTQTLSAIEPIQRSCITLLSNALGKVLVEDIVATKNLPSFNNSAMDGFAFKSEDAGKKVHINKSIFAGETPTASLKRGECYKIMTGAQVPNDADTIAPFEQCKIVSDTEVLLPKKIAKGANFRKRGEETTVGELLLPKGTLLRSFEIALLAAQGITAVKVFAPLNIAVFSSGNELKEPWEVASEDEIYNANAFGIISLLKSFGFEATYVGKLPDSLEATTNFIAKLTNYDVIISTGGISQGEADFLYQAFITNALEVIFHGVGVKPGHPTMVGKMGQTLVMGLPGNPLTTLLMAHTFTIPALYKLQGSSKVHHSATSAKLSQDIKLKPSRVNLLLGTIKHGEFIPTRGGKVGSGMLLPLCESTALAYFEKTELQKGELIQVIHLQNPSRSQEFALLN